MLTDFEGCAIGADFWQDQDMTMPAYDDADTPRLAEIARTLKDFRDEWRQGVQELVRKDVYAVHINALEAKIASLDTKISALENGNKEADQLSKSRLTLLYGTALAAGVSLLGWILTSIAGA
jgi:hypothetical protein